MRASQTLPLSALSCHVELRRRRTFLLRACHTSLSVNRRYTTGSSKVIVGSQFFHDGRLCRRFPLPCRTLLCVSSASPCPPSSWISSTVGLLWLLPCLASSDTNVHKDRDFWVSNSTRKCTGVYVSRISVVLVFARKKWYSFTRS